MPLAPLPPLTTFLLLAPLRRRGRSLHPLLLIVLARYGLLRLITVVLSVKRLLLLRSRIPIP